MKILRFQASNFMRLSAVEITPDSDGLVIVSGRNAQGKSSVLNAIWAALGGKSAIPGKPIHTGEDHASITLDLGDLTVQRTFTLESDGETTTALKLRRADGSQITKTPQAVLDALWDRLTIDPLAFAKSKPVEQFELLKRFVEGFDFDKNASDRKIAFDTRTAVNRDAKQLRARIAAIVLPAKKPVVEDIGALMDEQGEAIAHNQDIIEREQRRATAIADVKRMDAEIDELEERLEALSAKRAGLKKKLAEAPALPEKIDVHAINQRIAAVQETGKAAAAFTDRDRMMKEADDLEAKADLLTDALASFDQAKADAIANSKLPVKGLDLVDGAVILNGEPFAQASTAEQLRASIAIAGAMAPKLRVLRVAEGAFLDKAGLALVEAYARENDLQIWVEYVSDSDDVGVVIENGEVKS